ncbi:molybdopterin molybdenumtransferase MoeA [Clostridium bovifaecis]|uniref:Molybdopterin molybdenumtransferase n=1 Tax=Clostridium bovifaecis TaxID=2184719 RepID=A0A6I6EM23_9CLOT|nr:molybdopterin molybdenumtransferase MoeA [Clostridium bovifaecis]
MEMFKVHSVKAAREKLVENFKDFKCEVEEIEILEAEGRLLGEDIHSKLNVPHFRRSTVDGYAVISKDTYGASESLPMFLEVLGEVEMGKAANMKITTDKAVYVPTGGMIPEGADAVVMVEYVEKLDSTNITISRPAVSKENIIDVGDDIRENQKVLSKGVRLRPHDIGVLSSIGVDKVNVFKMPSISIISTGDEVIDPKEELQLGKIKDINTYTLSAMAKEIGLNIVERRVVKDNKELLKNTLKECIEKSDMVMLSGGSSVGTKDITTIVINEMGEPGVFVHGVAMKPGKPTILAKAHNKPLFGLPGQPASAMIAFKVFVEYFIKNIFNLDEYEDRFIEASMTTNIHSAPGKETYQMVYLEREDGEYKAHPVYGKSGMITLMSKAKGYIKIDEDKEGIKEGEKVRVNLF